ncbi:MAG TPA: ABC transporter permease, partial [Rhodothermales bacterium]|nr:ABC transporter permease [Rhodothermales bacterium]
MLRNYLVVAIRSLRRSRGYAVINVLGLAVGIAGALLVGLFVRNELAFDRFHERGERIYRPWVHQVTGAQDMTNTMTPRPLGPVLQEGFPEVEAMTRFEPRTAELRRGTDAFAEYVAFADPAFFEIFSFPFLAGSPATALARPDGIVLTDSAATRLFGTDDPVGEAIVVHVADRDLDAVVTAVVRVPQASGLGFDAVIPYALALTGPLRAEEMEQWFSISGETYVLLREGTDPDELTAKFPPAINAALPEHEGAYTVGLQNFLDIHLNPDMPRGTVAVRDPQMLLILGGIAALLLLVASINFTTLALGRSLDRAREVGVRKALGAHRSQ